MIDFDKLFDDFLGRPLMRTEWSDGVWNPSVDVSETKDNVIIRAEMPGLSKDDVKISMHDNMLTLTGEKKQEKEEKDANNACMPCHQERVENATAHTHHQEGSAGNKCISCHMPMTSFARMNRSDHSMLPPTPAATITYKSPNACNLCHTDKDAAWADKYVREWRPRDYQAPVLNRAALIEAGRKRDWSKLPEMLDYITSKDCDEIFATSLIRMIPASGDPRIVPVLCKAIKDPSPLVRASAADALQHAQSIEAFQSLVDATKDDYRLVRVRAVASLIGRKEDRGGEKA
jgi:hypothetical protein